MICKHIDSNEIDRQAVISTCDISANLPFYWICFALVDGKFCLESNVKVPVPMVLGRGLICNSCGQGLSSSLSVARRVKSNLL